MSIVAAVKAAIAADSDYWMLRLDEKEQDAYFGNYAADYRENGSEIEEFRMMRVANTVLREKGIRGLCYGSKP